MRDEIIEAATGQFSAQNPRALRILHGLTQQELADALGVSLRTLQGWEQYRRAPAGPARRLIELFAEHPEIFSAE